jgi:hypothetical protein
MTAQLIAEGLQGAKALAGELSGEGAPDPLIQLKEKEIQVKAEGDAADNQIDKAKLQLDGQNQEMRSEQFDERLAAQERQTAARIQAAMEREILKREN